MKRYLFILALGLTITVMISSCKKDNPVVPPVEPPAVLRDTVTLNITGVTHRSVEVNVKCTMNNEKLTILLYRRLNNTDTLAAEYPVEAADTIITDDNNGEGLQVDTEYKYYAVLRDTTGEIKDTSNSVSARTLPVTSHNYTWQEYTIGEFGSALYDVWGTDENNVWAVGSIYINNKFYGALHYNGAEWIPDSTVGGTTIYGFAEDDIWVAGGGVFHFDGAKWTGVEDTDPILHDNTPYTSIWGTSSSNLYLGNAWGKVIHWDGMKATIFAEPTTVPLTDINGLSDDFMLAAGSTLTTPSAGLIYNGIRWEDLQGLNFNTTLFRTVLCVSSKDYYICGSKNYRYLNGELTEDLSKAPGIIEKIRQDKTRGDIVAVGDGFTLLHYNGIDWKDYSYDLHQYNSAFYGVYVVNGYIFAVGSNNNNASIFIGKNN